MFNDYIVEGKERVRRNLVYEVEVVSVLGDYVWLLMFLGIIICGELLCMVM